MRIQCIGVNHESAPLALLEKLQLSEFQAEATLSRSGCGDQKGSDPLELALLSTCNRVELYGLLREPNQNVLALILAESADVSLEDIHPFLYQYEHQDAVRHLLRVASGLDSMVVGEPQILGQVADAYSLALRSNSAGIVINRAFQTAIHGGKRARSETGIATNPATTSSVAVHFASSIVQDIRSSRVTVLGAGEMAELTIEALRKRGVDQITVLNRTVDRARDLADRWNASAKSFESLIPTLRETDILLTSTGAPHPLIGPDAIREAMHERPDRPMVILDTAVPRDVERSVAEIDSVHLYDLEDLHQHLQGSLSQRLTELPAVEEIIEQELVAFEDWFRTFEIRPLIAELHQKAESIRSDQVERSISRLKDLGDDEREEIVAMTKALVKRLLHDPIMHLKHASRNGPSAGTAQVARELFNIGTRKHGFGPSEGQASDKR
jgi:glutamyl-tRNA reductase